MALRGKAAVKLDGPTPEQLSNGHYGRRFTMHVDSFTEAMTHVSRHDPVERWKAADRLSNSQMAAISLCQHLWELVGIRQKVTANYGERQGGASGVELRALSKIEARDDLDRIIDYFPGPLASYWQIFENVCRHGMSAGVAGGDDRNGAHTAFVIVCFVADFIATRENL